MKQKLSNLLQAIKPQPQSEELSFLPAVLEIQETPPSPVGRITAWMIMALFTLTLIWSIFGEVDIVAVAHGKIIPSGHSKIIQSVETSVVKAIHVKEGQKVKAGDVLIELDTTITRADFDNASQQNQALNAEQTRTQYLLKLLATQSSTPSPLAGEGWGEGRSLQSKQILSHARKQLEPLQYQILESSWREYQQQYNVLQSTWQQKQSELAAVSATISKLQQILPITEKRMSAFDKLFQKQLVSEHQSLELKQQYIEQTQDLETQRSIQQRITQEISSAQSQIEQHQYQYKRTLNQLQSDNATKINSMQQEVIKTGQRDKQYQLTSPIAGTVQQLAINTIGGVVTPAQQLMIIVPDKEQLEVEALIENKDIGFVEQNQQAEIKIDAFPFTQYGVIDGTVTSVSSDAMEHEKLGLVFAMRADMEKSKISVNGKLVNLSPGMSVSVEVKTGKRNIIDYLLRPAEEMMSSSIKER